MRIQLLSDLHFEFHADAGRHFVELMDPTSIDVLVLAGDIAVGDGIGPALTLFCERYAPCPVVYVHGNHEYYGMGRERVVAITQAARAAHSNLVWLDAEVAEIEGQRFIGGPLWFSRGDFTPEMKRSMPDFAEIPGFQSWVYEENERMRALLESELRPGDVVVTHHLPTYRSVAARYSGNSLNAFFVCDLQDLILQRRPAVWMHGHTHDSVRQRVGSTEVLCNPFGYVGHQLNMQFHDRCVVKV